eukprot:TRINITY_DN495_c0_g1_i1.p1 TRINITY_DN495_c0_g1~~TRINITY_DN495_c0_g1_i1.p1  ORF type:complete len:247 (+),score=128.50 TRINITY_DN495_c0_g1_i1:112-852(+)
MTSVGTGYDYSATTYSPEGRVFQIEYASKAVDNSGLSIGVRVKDGVVLGVEKIRVSKMHVEHSNRRLHTVERHIGCADAGLMADARNVVNRARSEAANYFDNYSHSIPVRALAERIAGFMQAHTLYGHVRPFGCSILLAGYDRTGPQLYMIEPNGIHLGYFGCTAGKTRQAAKTELEKLKLNELTCEQAIKEVARIIYKLHDENKDKDFELEIACANANGFKVVSKEILEQAENYAKESLNDEMNE